MASALINVDEVFSYLLNFKTTFQVGWFALFGRRSTDYGKPSFDVIFYRLKLILNGPINGARGRPGYMCETNAIFLQDYKHVRGR